MLGKEKCHMLRQIRQQIAAENDIALVTSECTYQGECKGTCPKCESELRCLEQQLEIRRAAGRKVLLAGISLTAALSLTGCRAAEIIEDTFSTLRGDPDPIEQLMGEVPYIEEQIDDTEGYVEYDGE